MEAVKSGESKRIDASGTFHPSLNHNQPFSLAVKEARGGVGRCRAAAILVSPPALPRWSRGIRPQTDSGETLVHMICFLGG